MVDEEIGMPAKRELSMRQLRHLLRLRHDGVSAREIGDRGQSGVLVTRALFDFPILPKGEFTS